LRVEEYAYYINKRRQNVGLKTCIWRQIVTSQQLTQIQMTTICHWMNPPMKIFCVRHWSYW